MKRFVAIMCVFTIFSLFVGCTSTPSEDDRKMENVTLELEVSKSEEEWKEILTPEQFYILREKGTERAYTGEYHNSKKKGIYRCAGCGNELFHSDAKFDSGTGWPSFWMPISEESVVTQADNGFFARRTEVLCSRCGGHLGHVFDDGPPPTDLRYCLNSLALDFEVEKENPNTEARE